MPGFETNGLRTPLTLGLHVGSTALGLMTRAFEPVANRLMLPADGPIGFVDALTEEALLDHIEESADLVRHNQGCGVPVVLEYGYTEVGKGVLAADASKMIPKQTVIKAAEVALDIHLTPRRLPLTQERVEQLDWLLDTARNDRKVFFLPSAR